MSSDVNSFIQLVLTILSIAIIGRAVVSWFDPTGRSPIQRILIDLTEPIIAPIRRVVPSMGMIDISPFIALLLIQVVSRMLASSM
jgi:YggT family protein